MKIKIYEILLFYVVMVVFWQIPIIAIERVFPNLTGWPKSIVFGIIFAVMCSYGRKYVYKKFNKYW